MSFNKICYASLWLVTASIDYNSGYIITYTLPSYYTPYSFLTILLGGFWDKSAWLYCNTTTNILNIEHRVYVKNAAYLQITNWIIK